jgi:hypothetical protein
VILGELIVEFYRGLDHENPLKRKQFFF